MNIYTIYIHDDRYSVATLDIIGARDDDEAQAEARARLLSSPHYAEIEIWVADRLVARIEADRED